MSGFLFISTILFVVDGCDDEAIVPRIVKDIFGTQREEEVGTQHCWVWRAGNPKSILEKMFDRVIGDKWHLAATKRKETVIDLNFFSPN